MIRDLSRGAWIAIVVGTLVIVVGIVLGFMAVFGFGLFSQSTANFRGETSKKNRVEANGAYRIAAYDHFFDLCASVQTDEASIKNLTNELATKPTSDRALVVRASITALRNNRAQDVNQYNVDARKSYTEGQFRDSDLPFQLDQAAQETTCTAPATP